MQHYENILELVHGSALVKVVRALLLVNELVDFGQWQVQPDLQMFADFREPIVALFSAPRDSAGRPIELEPQGEHHVTL